jgi:hypothetical protein
VKVKVTLFPKTVICLGDEELTVEDEYVGPIQAEIVEGENQLSPGEKSPCIRMVKIFLPGNYTEDRSKML